MPFIEYGQQLYPLRNGANTLGSNVGADIRIPDVESDCRLGINVEMQGAFAYAVSDGERIQINGRPLSAEPIPLFHGDRLSLPGSTFVFLDDVSDSKTAAKPASESPAAEPVPEPVQAAPPPTELQMIAVLRRHDTGEVYLVDRVHFAIGREKRSDLIIPDHAVSRLQAEITSSGGHHMLHDHGRTPTQVNGQPLNQPHRLQPGDVIQIGKYAYTFSRRPATAEELAGSNSVTPIRSAVPDAPTLMPDREKKKGASRALTWILLAVLAGLLAVIVFG